MSPDDPQYEQWQPPLGPKFKIIAWIIIIAMIAIMAVVFVGVLVTW